MRRIMKRLGAVAVIFLLLSGCTQQAVQKEQEEQPRTMSMVIASDAPTSIQLAAQEFANRLAYYSDGELEISLSASDQLDAVLTADDTQFAFVENERLSKTIEQLETFTLPFFFQDADYLFSGAEFRAHPQAAQSSVGRGVSDGNSDVGGVRLRGFGSGCNG